MSTEQQSPAWETLTATWPKTFSKALIDIGLFKPDDAPASGRDLETGLRAPAPPPRAESLPEEDPAIVLVGASFAAPEHPNPVDAKREELRKYLEKEGIREPLTKALVALYEEHERRNDALDYLKNNFASYEAIVTELRETKIANGLLNQKVETLEKEKFLLNVQLSTTEEERQALEQKVAGTAGDSQSNAAESSELWKNRERYPMIDRGGYIMHPRNPSMVHDLSDPVMVHVNTAEAILRRGTREHKDLPVIKELVEFNYIENKNLEKQFMAKKLEFQKAGRNTNELVMFHGTSPANTHDICTGNFNLDLSNRFAFGRGIYFSKCPNTSLQYGKDLILCRVLPGLKHETKWVEKHRQTLQDGFDSLEIDWQRNNDPGSNAIVVRAADQILPYCVIRTEHITAGSKVSPKNPPPKKAAPPQPKPKVAPPPSKIVTATPRNINPNWIPKDNAVVLTAIPRNINATPPPSKPNAKTAGAKPKKKKKNDCVIS